MRPNMTIAHDDSCMKIEISYPTDNSVGFVSFTLSSSKEGKCDWTKGISVDLGVFDMARVAQVLRGECEDLDLNVGSKKLLMRHLTKPSSGYAIGVAEGDCKCQIFIEPHEALALCEALSTTFFFVSFVKGVS